MATLAGIQVADKYSAFDSGAAFLLAQNCNIDEIVRPNPDWEVEFRSNSKYIVARGIGASNSADAFNSAHEIVQQAFDLLSITGKADFSIHNAIDECLIWWREQSTQVLRIISVIDLPIAVGPANLIVTDENGNVIPSPVPPPTIYHESLRYFRLSQITDDLFDAFRNMYLSFELLLDYIEPKLRGEREGRWIKRALNKINTSVPLSHAITPTTNNIVNEIYREIYIDIRCNIFHAKKASLLLPQSVLDRKKVNEGFKKLTRIVLLLVKHWLNVRRGGGLITYEGFDLMTLPLLSNSHILVSDVAVPITKDKNSEDQAFSNAIPLSTRYAPELCEPGLNFSLGTIDSSQLNRLKRIARIGLKHQDTVKIVCKIEEELTFENIDRFEAQMGIQLKNLRQPKSFFKA